MTVFLFVDLLFFLFSSSAKTAETTRGFFSPFYCFPVSVWLVEYTNKKKKCPESKIEEKDGNVFHHSPF